MSTNKIAIRVAKKLKETRISLELSQEALAEYAGIDRKTVNRIENNHFSPNLDTLLRLCVALSIEPVDLFDKVK
jgi:putative transcriptional regulator